MKNPVEKSRELTGEDALQNAVLRAVEDLEDGQKETDQGPLNSCMILEFDEEENSKISERAPLRGALQAALQPETQIESLKRN